jgi:hypothetical protein
VISTAIETSIASMAVNHLRKRVQRPSRVSAKGRWYYKHIAETRGCFRPMDPNLRRIHLGWEESVTPTDEGVRVFGGIWFNSDELQIAIDDARIMGRKLSVFVDPENMARATVLVPSVDEPIEVHLQITAFADMTLVEILDLMAEWRKENPKTAEIHNDRVMKFRSDIFKMMRVIGVERKLPRSFSTIAECRNKARSIFAGARIVPGRLLEGTVGPIDIMNFSRAENVFRIGPCDGPIEGIAVETDGEDTHLDPASPPYSTDIPSILEGAPMAVTAGKTRTARSKPKGTSIFHGFRLLNACLTA